MCVWAFLLYSSTVSMFLHLRLILLYFCTTNHTTIPSKLIYTLHITYPIPCIYSQDSWRQPGLRGGALQADRRDGGAHGRGQQVSRVGALVYMCRIYIYTCRVYTTTIASTLGLPYVRIHVTLCVGWLFSTCFFHCTLLVQHTVPPLQRDMRQGKNKILCTGVLYIAAYSICIV